MKKILQAFPNKMKKLHILRLEKNTDLAQKKARYLWQTSVSDTFLRKKEAPDMPLAIFFSTTITHSKSSIFFRTLPPNLKRVFFA